MMTTQTLQIPVSGTIEQKVDGVDLVRLLRQERYKESLQGKTKRCNSPCKGQ